MDRCALFVDASYVLADGAMAVHGTRRGESVSWDYEGLLQLLSSLARERSGLPLLRCYWYEASVDGRRTAEHDALADLPGIKLRLAKIRPGRREGVETEMHRDLTTLARNNAISDALVVSAEEDLAQVIADVQDLGMRVTLVHIAVDGNWTISRALRQESDDLIEISGEHLRPYVELIAGAEPARTTDEPDDTVAARSNGHLTSVASSYSQMSTGTANHAPPAIYTAPVVAEYQRPALQLPPRDDRPRDDRPRDDRPRDDRPRDDRPSTDRVREDRDRTREDRERVRDERDRPAVTAAAVEPPAVEPVQAPVQLRRIPARSAARDAREARDSRESRDNRDTRDARDTRDGRDSRDARDTREPAQLPAAQLGAGPGPIPLGPAPVSPTPLNASQHPGPGAPQPPHPGSVPPSARSAPYSGPQPVMSSGYSAQPAVSLADAVQAAHEEGQDFGESVARDAPALWLEAVLARKPRMPSDLEARLLQGSALPIDFLLHDEVRHALRRGFWDALERTRR
ncbi:MAG: NYN domain-containing protein [Streptosporangiaceae bacterium]|nr:NYN domain-containing protein [Streptosporangiaceae bacterium]